MFIFKLLHTLGWKPLHLRRRFHRCTTIFKCLHGFIDFNFHFVRNCSIHSYNTRSRDDFHLPQVTMILLNKMLELHEYQGWRNILTCFETCFLSCVQRKTLNV